jgi:hypothetical protein
MIELICKNPNCKLVDGRFDVKCKTHIRKYCLMSCMKSHTADKKVAKNLAKELAEKNKVYTKKVKSVNKIKDSVLFKHFSNFIIGYEDKGAISSQLKTWIPHINKKPEYVDMCNKKIAECGGKIPMLVFASFVSSNCSEAKLSGLDKDIKF